MWVWRSRSLSRRHHRMNPFSEGLAVAPAQFLIGRLELFCEVETPLHSDVMSGSLHKWPYFSIAAIYGCVVTIVLIIQEAELHRHHVGWAMGVCDCRPDTGREQFAALSYGSQIAYTSLLWPFSGSYSCQSHWTLPGLATLITSTQLTLVTS